MNRGIGLLTFFLLLLFISCNNQRPKGAVLSKEKMQAVLWDMIQADAFTTNFIRKDSSKNEQAENAALQKKIFELHKISRSDFTSSYNYYSGQPDVMKTILDSVSAKAERDRSKIMKDRYGGMKSVVE